MRARVCVPFSESVLGMLVDVCTSCLTEWGLTYLSTYSRVCIRAIHDYVCVRTGQVRVYIVYVRMLVVLQDDDYRL